MDVGADGWRTVPRMRRRGGTDQIPRIQATAGTLLSKVNDCNHDTVWRQLQKGQLRRLVILRGFFFGDQENNLLSAEFGFIDRKCFRKESVNS